MYDRHADDKHEARCPACDGEGVVEVDHPRYGTPSCPEPTVRRTCGPCEGVGRFDWTTADITPSQWLDWNAAIDEHRMEKPNAGS